MLDIQKARHAYFHPSADPPDHILTREEQIGRLERRRVDLHLEYGDDPRELGRGEHGSLIGGPGKPLRIGSAGRPEYDGPWTPLPLTWFTHPNALARRPGDPPDDHGLLHLLIGAHLAGYGNQPTAAELRRILRSETANVHERSILYHIFGCIDPWDLSRLLYEERLSVYEVARAIHHSGIPRPQVIDWLHMFASRPTDEPAP